MIYYLIAALSIVVGVLLTLSWQRLFSYYDDKWTQINMTHEALSKTMRRKCAKD